MKRMILRWGLSLLLLASLVACHSTDPVTPPDSGKTEEEAPADLKGFYLLNSGEWGKNNASLTYVDFEALSLTNNWWKGLNPTVRGGLGDMGNDLVASGEYLLAVLNSSNLLEICDRDGKHLGEVEIANCRRVAVVDGYAYVTSYAPAETGGEGGHVAKVSLAERKIVARCAVDKEPERLFVRNGKLYVFNTYGYSLKGATQSTCSVIDLATFTETARKGLGALNPYGDCLLLPDGKTAYVPFSGDYAEKGPSCSLIDLDTFTHVKDFAFTAGNYAALYDGKLYIMGTAFSYDTMDWAYSNWIYDPASDKVTEMPFAEDAFSTYQSPAGIWVRPGDGHIYIGDSGDYKTPGYLYHYDTSFRQSEKLAVGICPAALAWDLR